MIESSKMHVTVKTPNNYIKKKKKISNKSWYTCRWILCPEVKKKIWGEYKLWGQKSCSVCKRMTHIDVEIIKISDTYIIKSLMEIF